jgi:hypothetical protein
MDIEILMLLMFLSTMFLGIPLWVLVFQMDKLLHK